MRLLAVFLGLLLLPPGAYAKAPVAPGAPIPVPTARPEPADSAAEAGAPRATYPGGVSTSLDLAYGAAPLTLDVYQPRAKDPLPLLVFVHGGGWTGGDARHAAPFPDLPRTLAGLAAQGYVVASINYRLSPQAHFPAALQDVKAALRWLRGQSAALHIDATRVAVWGLSSGGQLAAMAGVTCGVPRFEPDGSSGANLPSDCADAVIDWYGPTDLTTRHAAPDHDGTGGTTPEGAYLGCEPAACPPAVTRLASPLAFANAMSPPFLIQHGAADTDVPVAQSQALYDVLKAKGAPAELVLYPDAGHDFVKDGHPDPATAAQALDRMTAFLAATFADGRKPARRARRGAANPRKP